MKKWYQYRCEEIIGDSAERAYFLMESLFMSEAGLSRRLVRFLFVKVHMGGIKWLYQCGLSGWRAIYGSCAARFDGEEMITSKDFVFAKG